MKYKSLVLKIWFWWIVLGLIIVFIWFAHIIPSGKEEIILNIQSYKNEEYSGLIMDKYIDKDEHNFKKVIIFEGSIKRTILFNNESGNLYNFLEIGDSVVKEIGSLNIRVKRPLLDLDTVVQIKLVGLQHIKE